MMRKLIGWGAAVMVLGFLCASVSTYVFQWHGWRPTRIQGVVLREDNDVRKQVPIAHAEVTATNGRFEASGFTDPAGYFNLEIRPSWQTQPVIKLLVRHINYSSLELPKVSGSELYTLHMQPKDASATSPHPQKTIAITDVRVRYSIKTNNTVNIGSAANTFEVPGQPDVHCDSQGPCSPDGKWKITSSNFKFDAGERAEFRNTRLSCIAGPCPFTRVTAANMDSPVRFLTLTIDNWSSAATFLLEAEVTQTNESDMVRRAYPVIFGSSMNFTLPPSAQGPSVEAALDGQDIVFPLGPDLMLSWAECSGQQAAENAQQYRCILKPGYAFH